MDGYFDQRRKVKMKRTVGIILFLCLILCVETQAQQPPTALRVQLGKSLLITSPEPLQRVSVTDPAIATAVIISPTQVLIHGVKAGSETLILWDTSDRARSFDLIVDVDIVTLRESIRQMFPSENLQVTQSGSSLVLTGNVSAKEVSDRVAALAATMSPNVVNLVQTTNGRQVVLLQVRFAEVDRTALQQAGVTLFSTGATNTLGVIGTHQFASPAANVGAIPETVNPGSEVKAQNLVAGGIGRTGDRTPASFGFSDLLNIFLFRPDLNLGAAIKALQQKNVLQILAEPNVMAMNGTDASFLAGGEFPFPVVQGGANVGAVTIQFKEFGIRLNFKPQIMPDGVIRLKVAPEVSALDFANGLSISGFTIPALSSRKALTEVELRDGQSFAIAGLIDNRMSEVAQKIPGLGDIPILGTFFKSRSQNKTNTELLVMVTPKLVEPLSPAQVPALPEFPKPFLDPQKFDGKSGEVRPSTPGVRP
jgi:pilus assembly protein CpaC